MRRESDGKPPTGGRFEAVFRAPTLGLVTRVPGDQPDPRSATVASNVRFDDGVIRNAPGCQSVLFDAQLDSSLNLIFQANVSPANGIVPTLGSILLCTSRKLYHLTSLDESEFGLFEEQVIEFRGEIRDYNMLRQLPTATRTKPQLFGISIADDMEIWRLRARGSAEADDGAAFLLPIDYGIQTNNVILARCG